MYILSFKLNCLYKEQYNNIGGKMKLNKTTKRLISLTVSLVLLAVVLSGCQFVQVDPEVEKNTVVAEVYGEEIIKEEFVKVFDNYKAYYDTQYKSDVWEQVIDGKKYIDIFKEKVLDILVDTKIQLKKADELGIAVSDEDVEEEINKVREYFDDEEKFNEYLSNNNITIEDFKKDKKTELTIYKLRDKFTENLEVTDEDVAIYYTTHPEEFISVKASHILLETEEEAKNVLDMVNEGKDFNELAKEYSKDPSVSENDGDLGYFRTGNMVEPFEKAAFALKPGEVSDIVATDFGFHIIKVEDRKNDKLEDIRDELRTNILEEKKNTEYMNKLEELRTEAEIVKNLKNL